MQLAIKIDVDTDKGTRIGVVQLLTLFAQLNIQATFLFSLGPDNTGRAIKRIFQPGFLKKIRRTNVIGNYGLSTLLNGVLWPGPHIAKKNAAIMRLTQALGHEVGIHCYDHIHWQDHLKSMSEEQVRKEFKKARDAFQTVFGRNATTAGAAGWQANKNSLHIYDETNLTYASDMRGYAPFYPSIGKTNFKTLQIPTTLPTLDEVLGLPEFPLEQLTTFYLSQLKKDQYNILTVHAELEGIAYLNWFKEFLQTLKKEQIKIVTLDSIAKQVLESSHIPTCQVIQGKIPGRSGLLAKQA